MTIISFLLFFHLYLSVATSNCTGDQCELFQCSLGPQEISSSDMKELPIFERVCSCRENWNTSFCTGASERSFVHRDHKAGVASVCICRKLLDEGSRCDQFTTKCFRHENGCKCCFNQPEEFCDMIPCSDDEPHFEKANTTCMCFTSDNFPDRICPDLVVKTASPYFQDRFDVLGVQVSSALILGIVVLCIIAAGVITGICLVYRTHQMKVARQREQEAIPPYVLPEDRRKNGEDEAMLPTSQ